MLPFAHPPRLPRLVRRLVHVIAVLSLPVPCCSPSCLNACKMDDMLMIEARWKHGILDVSTELDIQARRPRTRHLRSSGLHLPAAVPSHHPYEVHKAGFEVCRGSSLLALLLLALSMPLFVSMPAGNSDGRCSARKNYSHDQNLCRGSGRNGQAAEGSVSGQEKGECILSIHSIHSKREKPTGQILCFVGYGMSKVRAIPSSFLSSPLILYAHPVLSPFSSLSARPLNQPAMGNRHQAPSNRHHVQSDRHHA